MQKLLIITLFFCLSSNIFAQKENKKMFVTFKITDPGVIKKLGDKDTFTVMYSDSFCDLDALDFNIYIQRDSPLVAIGLTLKEPSNHAIVPAVDVLSCGIKKPHSKMESFILKNMENKRFRQRIYYLYAQIIKKVEV